MEGFVLLRVVFVGLLSSLTGSFFFGGLLSIIVFSVLFCLAFHKVPLILNASFGGNGGCHTPSRTQLFLWFCSG